MYKSPEEKLSDNMMGEAVLALLRQDIAINNSSLMMTLQSMLAVETDSLKQVALKRAIEEVCLNQCATPATNALTMIGRADTFALFSDGSPVVGTKKH